jgi:hypothetical protein
MRNKMEKIPLKIFYETVEQRLADCSVEELRHILRAMAQRTSPSERQAFLEKLKPPADLDSLAQQAPRDDLLAEIENLASELEEAMEDAEGWEEVHGWYEEYDEEESSGPYEDFLPPLARLFDQAQAAFDYGNLSLASDAYRALFELCIQQDDYGRGVSIEDLEGVEKDEAYARYLRAVYETTPANQRAGELFEQMLQVQSWIAGSRPTFEDVIQISPKPLPDLDHFWPEWIAFLREQPGYEADARLREAIRLSQGTPGLEELARTQGKQRPRAYLDWLAALEQEGRYSDELSAAQVALRTLPAGLPIRAAVADHLCTAALQLKDTQVLRAGRWEAFVVAPLLERLLDLWDVTPDSERVVQMQQAVRHIRNYLAQPRPQLEAGYPPGDDLERPVWISNTVLVHANLLADDWHVPHQMAANEKVLGWSSSENVQGFVLAFFLVLLSGKPTAGLPGNLAQLWQERLVNSTGYWYSEEKTLPRRLERAYAKLFEHLTLNNSEQSEALAWCLEIANRRVDAIVGGQHRGSYHKAAMLITACAEVLELRGEKDQTDALLSAVRNRFPRHRAFQSELNSANKRKSPGNP